MRFEGSVAISASAGTVHLVDDNDALPTPYRCHWAISTPPSPEFQAAPEAAGLDDIFQETLAADTWAGTPGSLADGALSPPGTSLRDMAAAVAGWVFCVDMTNQLRDDPDWLAAARDLIATLRAQATIAGRVALLVEVAELFAGLLVTCS